MVTNQTHLHINHKIENNNKPESKEQKTSSNQDSGNNTKINSHYNLRKTKSIDEKNDKMRPEESNTSKAELKSNESMEDVNKSELELKKMVENPKNQPKNKEKPENEDNNEDIYEPFATYNANILERLNLGDFEPFGEPIESETLLPIANISRLMRKVLPNNAKIAKQAKDLMRECATEFIFFISSEATARCREERRKTLNSEDIFFSITKLGFEHYDESLKEYHNNWKKSKEANLTQTNPRN